MKIIAQCDITGALIFESLEHSAPDDLQKAVGGGYIETIPYFETYEGQACVAFCNEEGKLNDLAFNLPATVLWHKVLRSDQRYRDQLVGPIAILTGDSEFLLAL